MKDLEIISEIVNWMVLAYSQELLELNVLADLIGY